VILAHRIGHVADGQIPFAGLPNDHPLRTRENVFAFSMSCASMEMLQMLALVLAPLNQPNPGVQLYHFVGNITEEPAYGTCHPECQFPSITAMGDDWGILATCVKSNPGGRGCRGAALTENRYPDGLCPP
jgi:hypothetical protein